MFFWEGPLLNYLYLTPCISMYLDSRGCTIILFCHSWEADSILQNPQPSSHFWVDDDFVTLFFKVGYVMVQMAGYMYAIRYQVPCSNPGASPQQIVHLPAAISHEGLQVLPRFFSIQAYLRWCSAQLKGIGIYGGFLKWWYQTAIGFPTKNDHFVVFWGYHHFRKHPYNFLYTPNCIIFLPLG